MKVYSCFTGRLGLLMQAPCTVKVPTKPVRMIIPLRLAALLTSLPASSAPD